MTKRPRKPLDDSLASNFVFGEGKPGAEQPPSQEISEPPPTPSVEPESGKASAPEPISIAPMTEEKASATQSSKELSLMDKLQLQPKEATKRFTIDLEESLHRELSILAAQTGRTKADIVRMLLKDAIQSLKE
jgi:hypothetical protein